ncbi:unnamed protein product [Mytilus coruscus]|uniref:Uncharacterized protein n=1 Tax=Mytilus coruscus TaxID=42192 RepID=A0A6J8ASN2_MYTCO|nr:unnamed protein product [Mytilus coruscus]
MLRFKRCTNDPVDLQTQYALFSKRLIKRGYKENKIKTVMQEVTAKQTNATFMVKLKSILQSPPLIFSTVFSRQKTHLKNNILKHWDKLKDDKEAKLLFAKKTSFRFPGTVGKKEENPSLGEISFDFKMDSVDLSHFNLEKEGLVTQCLEELRKHTQKETPVNFTSSLDQGSNSFFNEKLDIVRSELSEQFLSKLIEMCEEHHKSTLSSISNLLEDTERQLGCGNSEKGALLKKLTYQVKEKKDIWNERYLRAIRNMSAPSNEKLENEENTISKLQEELRKMRSFLEPSHRGRG